MSTQENQQTWPDLNIVVPRDRKVLGRTLARTKPWTKEQMSPWAIMNPLVHFRHELGKITGLENLLVGTAMPLKTVVLRTPVNEWLDPMKEAPSFEGASFISCAGNISKRLTK